MAKVLVIYTGGTIGMRPRTSDKALAPQGVDAVAPVVEDLAGQLGLDVRLETLQQPDGNPYPPVDSADVGYLHWQALAEQIGRAYHEVDGFVILHGTDTLAFTASALSFLLENLSKPVVVTGAQRPLASLRTDARQNLINSLYVAGAAALGLPVIPEVVICFADQVLRGNRAHKASTLAWAGFQSSRYPALARIGGEIRVDEAAVRPLPEGSFQVRSGMVADVLDISLFPGIRLGALGPLLADESVKGVVLRAFGGGTVPGNRTFLEAIRLARQSGTVIVAVSQCEDGLIDLGAYGASSRLGELGVIAGRDMTAEAALTKLMWLLGSHQDGEIEELMVRNLRGELSL
ncbi:MAG: asparaginase [Magnetovibrionaceae bacterium]